MGFIGYVGVYRGLDHFLTQAPVHLNSILSSYCIEDRPENNWLLTQF